MPVGVRTARGLTRTALITGANRGIGLAVAQQLLARDMRVVMTARDLDAVRAVAVATMPHDDKGVRTVRMDLADPASIRACAAALDADGIGIDVLINNAGLYSEGDVLAATEADFDDAMRVNVLGPLLCAREWLPGMLARAYGRIVNLSSGYACFSQGMQGPAAYAVSKAALNAATIKLAQACTGDVKVVAVDPGWVRTRMGGPQAPRSADEAAADIVWAATLPEDAPNGVLYRRRSVVAW